MLKGSQQAQWGISVFSDHAGDFAVPRNVMTLLLLCAPLHKGSSL